MFAQEPPKRQQNTSESTENLPVVEYQIINSEGASVMNKNICKAMQDIEKVDAIMFAIENTYLDIEVVPVEAAKADRAVNAFYALWDAVNQVKEDIERISGDETVIDTIYAVNDVCRRKQGLDTVD